MLVNALADKSTHITQTLKRLTIRLFLDMKSQETERYSPLECVLGMLRANEKLEYLEVEVPSEAYEARPLEDFRRFHKQVLPAMGNQLPLDCRIAFLSIFVTGRCKNCIHDPKQAKSSSVAAIPMVQHPVASVLADFPTDRNVLSLIFDFAATCVRRRVYVVPYNDIDPDNLY